MRDESFGFRNDAAGQRARAPDLLSSVHPKLERQTEDVLRHSERTDRFVALLSAVIHEINNPLESLSDILHLLEHQRKLDRESRVLVDYAREELERVREVASNTLYISHPDLSFTPLDVHQIIEAVLDQLRIKAESAGVLVARDYRPAAPIEVSEPHLRQLFTNIIRNAIEAAGPTGRVIVRLRPSRDFASGVRGARILVCDSGKGVDPETKRNLGEAFESSHADGTGLGMWVSSEIVRKHGGKLRAKNIFRHGGACFMIFLPQNQGAAQVGYCDRGASYASTSR